jgi:hypothetical protein
MQFELVESRRKRSEKEDRGAQFLHAFRIHLRRVDIFRRNRYHVLLSPFHFRTHALEDLKHAENVLDQRQIGKHAGFSREERGSQNRSRRVLGTAD